MNERILIVFIKNPVLGRVKTRLAKTFGEERTLDFYKKLVQQTHKEALKVTANRVVFYSDEIEFGDIWDVGGFQKQEQTGSDNGKRMMNAMKWAFGKGYRKVVIVDCESYGLTARIINGAFDELARNNFVIGPTHNGGYYMLGMNQLYAPLLRNKKWNSEEILHDTLVDIRNMNGSYKLFEELVDVDTEEDLLLVKIPSTGF